MESADRFWRPRSSRSPVRYAMAQPRAGGMYGAGGGGGAVAIGCGGGGDCEAHAPSRTAGITTASSAIERNWLTRGILSAILDIRSSTTAGLEGTQLFEHQTETGTSMRYYRSPRRARKYRR
jgi:hypothetical protein